VKAISVKRATTAALLSALVGVLALGMKYAAFLATNSVALYSDAVESIVNIVAALGVYVALRISARPADEDHPYGYTKVEYFSAVIEGALVIAVAFNIAQNAYEGFVEPRKHLAPALGLSLSAIATGVNAAWWLVLKKTAKELRSPALKAEAKHLFADVASSVGVFIGFGVAVLTGWWVLDPLIAALIAVNVVWSGITLMWDSVSSLLDRSASENVRATIDRALGRFEEELSEIIHVRTRQAGSTVFVDLKIGLPSEMSVAEMHDIVTRIRDAIEERVPGARVAIRVEPVEAVGRVALTSRSAG
jgi:cation diffusion facilitator family transporter